MTAINDVAGSERYRRWYDPDLTEVNSDIRSLLERYSKIPADKVVGHVNEIRARGFEASPYPCIGGYRFLNLTLLTHPLYPTVLNRLASSPTSLYLDLGCCFGQDLRQLAQDGVPSSQLIGVDIEQPLMDLGYELFHDRDSIESRFLVGDIFTMSRKQEPWREVVQRGGADVVHCSALFHLFPLTQQVEIATRIAKTGLLKVGGVFVGRQSGSVEPGEVPAVQAGTTSYRHGVDTWRKMWERVGETTGTRWRVEGSLDSVGIWTDRAKTTGVENENSRRLLFSIERLE